MLLGQPPGGWPRTTAFRPGGSSSGLAPLPGRVAPAAMPPQLLAAMASPMPSGLGGMQALPSYGGAMPMGAGAFLPAGMQPGLSGGGYQLPPYGFTPAPTTGAAVGAKPFVPGQSLQNQPNAPVMPANWSPEMKQRFILLQRLLGDRRELDPALFAARMAWRDARTGIGGGFEGKGPAAAGGFGGAMGGGKYGGPVGPNGEPKGM